MENNVSPSEEKSSNKKYIYQENLLALYNITQGEITRYRDREWANTSLFLASMTIIIGFIVANPIICQSIPLVFDIALVSLAIGNIFYSCYAHTKLTIQRNIKKRIEYALKFSEAGVNGKNIIPCEIKKPNNKEFCEGWLKGFWDHLLPFFLAGIALAAFGIWFLHTYNVTNLFDKMPV